MARRRFSASLSVAIDEVNTHTSMQSVVSPIISIIEHLSCYKTQVNLRELWWSSYNNFEGTSATGPL
jgi:hypothetical protein